MKLDLRSWIKLNSKLILSSCAVSFLSASVSGISLVLVQGVFGKEKAGSTSDLASRAIEILGENRAILLSILIWGLATYYLNNYNERITSIRLEAKRVERKSKNTKITAQERRLLTSESNFFEGFIGFANHGIRLTVFAAVLIQISPTLIKVDIALSILYLLFICKKRFQKGLQNGAEDRRKRLELKAAGNEKDFSQVFDLFIQRSWLSARLDKVQLSLFVLLILSPFLLSDIFSLDIIEEMTLLNFSTMLIFFSSALAMAIHAASLGFRFVMAFTGGDSEAEDS